MRLLTSLYGSVWCAIPVADFRRAVTGTVWSSEVADFREGCLALAYPTCADLQRKNTCIYN